MCQSGEKTKQSPKCGKELSDRSGDAKNEISIKFYIDPVVQKISKLFFFDDKK